MNIYAIRAIGLATFMKTEKPILNLKSTEDVYSLIGTYRLYLHYYDILFLILNEMNYFQIKLMICILTKTKIDH